MIPPGTTRLAQDHCPHCRSPIDSATDATGEATPQPGDFTICLYCAAVLQFVANLKVILATSEAIATLKPRDVAFLVAAQKAVQLSNKSFRQ